MKQKQIPKKFIKFLKQNFEPEFFDLDIHSYYDREISESENRDEFLIKYKNYLKEKVRDLIEGNYEKGQEEQHKEEQENRLREEEKKLIENWKNTKPTEINITSFKIPKMFLEMTTKKISNGTILIGEGGCGKSYLTLNEVKRIRKDYIYLNTHLTALEFYKILYRNNDKLIIIDDIKSIFSNEVCINLLKSCLWDVDNKRLITYNSSSAKLEECPQVFDFKGQIIILANKLNLKNINLEALESRVNYFEIQFTYKEKLEIMKQIIKEPYLDTSIELRKKALKLIRKFSDITTTNFNFRTLIKTYQYLIYDEKQTETLLKSSLRIDNELEFIRDMIEKKLSIAEQKKLYSEEFGKSYRTYQRKKRELLKNLK